jgi:cytosine/adenosine deaminase-related metal-dependent hydrolase
MGRDSATRRRAMTADDRGWCAYPSEAKRDPASTLDLPRGEDDGNAASRASRVAMTRVKVPSACCEFDEDATDGGEADEDGLIEVDVTIDVDRGMIEGVRESTSTRTRTVGEEETADYAESDEDEDGRRGLRVAMGGRMCLPTFVDIHTHIDKAHTCERSRNLNGTLAGADAACANDFQHWTLEDAKRRMGFAIQCAYAYGTSAMRTHLMSGEERQSKIAWEAFGKLREEWRGKVELQGVSLSVLSFFRDETKARALARMVKSYGGILGAAVSCSDAGGTPLDVHTTCGADMPKLLDVIFSLAKEYNLDVDFHCDENGNESSKGLLHISEAVIRNSFKGSVVCGHCCSLAVQPNEQAKRIIDAAREAGVTVVSLPIVNQWLQNRDPTNEATPTRRGVTRVKELARAGVPVCLSSDNTRDQFFQYGDCDMLEVFRSSVCIAHLDRPFGSWPLALAANPSRAMRLGEKSGMIAPGAKANFVLFRARNYSELFSRSQHDRVVIRDGVRIATALPDYEELD